MQILLPWEPLSDILMEKQCCNEHVIKTINQAKQRKHDIKLIF